MTIILKKQDYDEILAHALINLPNEACGLLGGQMDGEVKTVEKVYLLTNADQSPEHFSLDPKEQFAVIKDIRSRNGVLLGNFHSHPASPSRPSEEDKRLAYDPEVSYQGATNLELGEDYGGYPQAKTVLLGVRFDIR